MKKKLHLKIGVYEGEVNKKDKPHGKGVLITTYDGEKQKYVGEFIN